MRRDIEMVAKVLVWIALVVLGWSGCTTLAIIAHRWGSGAW